MHGGGDRPDTRPRPGPGPATRPCRNRRDCRSNGATSRSPAAPAGVHAAPPAASAASTCSSMAGRSVTWPTGETSCHSFWVQFRARSFRAVLTAAGQQGSMGTRRLRGRQRSHRPGRGRCGRITAHPVSTDPLQQSHTGLTLPAVTVAGVLLVVGCTASVSLVHARVRTARTSPEAGQVFAYSAPHRKGRCNTPACSLHEIKSEAGRDRNREGKVLGVLLQHNNLLDMSGRGGRGGASERRG